MASKTEICNLAILHLGSAKAISNLDTDQSTEGSVCRRFYPETLRAVLRDCEWPFASKTIELGLIETDPTTEWKYSYRYPSDCVKYRRILSGVRKDTLDSSIEYRILRDLSGKIIYTDQENACGEYTLLNDDPAQYPSDFTLALSYRLAVYIAPSLTSGDPFKMGDKAMNNYLLEVSRAQANSFNEESRGVATLSEFQRSRE